MHGELIHKCGLHRRAGYRQRRLFHSHARNRFRGPQGSKFIPSRNNPSHRPGIFQPKNGASHQIRGQEAGKDEDYRWKRRVLGDQRGIPDPRLQIRRWDQHSAWRKHHYDALPVREVPQAQAEDRRNLDDRRG